jgi:hypothetical protein
MRAHLVALSCLALVACAGSPLAADKPLAEEDAPVDGAFDSFRSTTDHGELVFGRAERASLTAAAGFHSWTFTLTGPASVTLLTQLATPSSRELDTVLYLYRETASGWGRALTSNDDSPGSLFSAISRSLTAGHYRIIVKGYVRATRGAFGVLADCTGAGCSAATPAPACLFGADFSALSGNTRLLNYTTTHAVAAELSAVQAAQLVAAMNAAGHAEITTADAAFALATAHTAERIELYDTLGGRAFTAWRFTLAAGSLGTIFAAGTTNVVSRITGSATSACAINLDVCTVGASYREFRDGTSLTVVSDRVLSSAAGLTAARAAQLLRAVQESYTEVRTPAEAIARVGGATVNETIRRDASSGKTFVAYEYSAGDNSYGTIFEGSSAVPVGLVHDGDMYGCTVFSATP